VPRIIANAIGGRLINLTRKNTPILIEISPEISGRVFLNCSGINLFRKAPAIAQTTNEPLHTKIPIGMTLPFTINRQSGPDNRPGRNGNVFNIEYAAGILPGDFIFQFRVHYQWVKPVAGLINIFIRIIHRGRPVPD
jgi:hypothetical protein